MSTKHTHKLKKHKYSNGTAVFFCTLPDCHFKVEAPLALGKESLCNLCGEVFVMDEYTMRLNRPHCRGCGRREVKDSDGKKRYINIRRGSEILTAIASDEVDSLRNRLSSITGDDDI